MNLYKIKIIIEKLSRLLAHSTIFNIYLNTICCYTVYAGACRVAWSILLALGARDLRSNRNRPTSSLFFLLLYLDIFFDVRQTFRKLDVMSDIGGCVDNQFRTIRGTATMHAPGNTTADRQPLY